MGGAGDGAGHSCENVDDESERTRLSDREGRETEAGEALRVGVGVLSPRGERDESGGDESGWKAENGHTTPINCVVINGGMPPHTTGGRTGGDGVAPPERPRPAPLYSAL